MKKIFSEPRIWYLLGMLNAVLAILGIVAGWVTGEPYTGHLGLYAVMFLTLGYVSEIKDDRR